MLYFCLFLVLIVVLVWYYYVRRESFYTGPQIVLYKADWCPHCAAIMPVWYDFVSRPHIWDVRVVDCTDEARDGITSYPTIALYNNGKRTLYGGEKSTSAIESWAYQNL